MESNLKLYSLGIVVETKPPGTDIILVSPIEVLNIQKPGSIKDNSTKFEGSLKNVDNKSFKSELRASNYLKAKWLPFGQSNRITAPDVVANETVILFKFGDVDEYYWTTIFREVELRRLETVLYGFSNIKNGITPFDKSTSYWLEVDTKNKTVKFHTSMNDGEYTEYNITIDTKTGTLNISDKKNNFIHLDSSKDHITINTNSSITAITKNFNVNAPNILLNGNVVITQNLQVNNGVAASGNVTMSQNLQVNGNINASGSIIDAGGNTANHTH